MLKISPNFNRSVRRYLNKNTVNAKYNRDMDTAFVSGLVAVGEAMKFPHYEPYDLGIIVGAVPVFLKNVVQGMIHLIELQPIRRRAIKIKKAVKLAQKNTTK